MSNDSTTMLMSWCGYFSSRCSLTCAVTSFFQRFKTCRWSRANVCNTSLALWPLFKTSFNSPDFIGRHSTTANSSPAGVCRWQTEVIFVKSTACCHCVPSSVWMMWPDDCRAALECVVCCRRQIGLDIVNGITVRFELFQMFREMLHGLGVGLFLKRCGSFVVVHNLTQIGFQKF